MAVVRRLGTSGNGAEQGGGVSYSGCVLEPSENPSDVEAIIDEGGNGIIPADQLPHRYPAGTHLRVHIGERVASQRRPVEGVLATLPELSWDDFREASRLATEDAEAAYRTR